MTANTMNTQEHLPLIRREIEQYALDIAEMGHICKDESFWIDNDEACIEIEVNIDASLEMRWSGDYDLPSTCSFEADYYGKATVYSQETGEPLYTVPVSGKVKEYDN